MTIKEVEQCLEVPRATVRFYEKEGLINPQRGDNGYREYSEADVQTLKKIIILRMLGLNAVVGLPIYLLGKKYPRVAKHKTAILLGCYAVLLILLIVFIVILNAFGTE